jgi:serine/threonine protein kinase
MFYVMHLLYHTQAMEEPVARTFLGTRGYLAPEMLQRRDYTKAVDTWSLGVIVFVLLCGCLPFDDDSAMVPSDDLVRAKFVLRFPRWAKNLSASAKDLLSHLLDVNPMTRYTADQAMAHPWVRGDTASRANLLASPKRIRPSPRMRSPAVANMRRPVAGGGGGGGGGGGVTHARKTQPDTPPTPQPVRVRKKSI